MFILGLDLGQARDYTALAILQKLEQEIYHVRRLERTGGTPYPEVVARVREVMGKLSSADLVVDATGVGAPVVDLFHQDGLHPVAIYIYGGDKVNHEGASWWVPKRDLVAVLQVLLQNGRLKVAPGPLSDTLTREMLNFKVKIDPQTAHDSYSAWREQDHDDLVLAVALACWWGESMPAPTEWTPPTKTAIDEQGGLGSVLSPLGRPFRELGASSAKKSYDEYVKGW